MMYDVYLDYKLKYPKEIVLIKSGTFYVAMNEDAFILYKIFDYKLNNFKHGVKVGFPSSSLGKVEKQLMRLHLSYVVVDKDQIRRKKARKNRYESYSKGMDGFLDNQKRIQKIYERLKYGSQLVDISKTLDKVEEIVCKID